MPDAQTLAVVLETFAKHGTFIPAKTPPHVLHLRENTLRDEVNDFLAEKAGRTITEAVGNVADKYAVSEQTVRNSVYRPRFYHPKRTRKTVET